MPAILFLVIYVAWKCFYVGQATTSTKEGGNQVGCLLFVVMGIMGFFLLLLGIGSGM